MSETQQQFFFNVKIILQKGKTCLEIFPKYSLPVDLNSLINGNDTLTDAQNEILFGIVQHYIKKLNVLFESIL